MRDNQGSNTMRDATFSRRDMLMAAGALAVGSAFSEPPKAAAAEPAAAPPARSDLAEASRRFGRRRQNCNQKEALCEVVHTALPTISVKYPLI